MPINNFIGTLDGRGHVIRNLYIPGDFYAGLFGYPYFPDTTPPAYSTIDGSVTSAHPELPMTVELLHYIGEGYSRVVDTITYEGEEYASYQTQTLPFRFVVPKPEPYGTYAVAVRKDRYEDYMTEGKTLAAGKDLDFGSISLKPNGEDIMLNIKLLDSNGNEKGSPSAQYSPCWPATAASSSRKRKRSI